MLREAIQTGCATGLDYVTSPSLTADVFSKNYGINLLQILVLRLGF